MRLRRKGKNYPLSVLMVRDGVRLKDAIKPGLRRLRAPGVGNLYYKQNPRTEPKWLSYFENALEEKPALYSASNGAILIVTRGKRTFAVCFGQGRHLLQPGSVEDNFGLRVTLNSVDPDRLKSVDRKSFDAISCHSRTQASQAGDVTAFGLNIEQDLLRAATGYPIDPSLGARMTGMDSLLVATRTPVGSLPALLDKYLVQFEDDSYRSSFPWVDHIAEVRDAALREKLDTKLVALVQAADTSDTKAWLAVPELIEWASVGGFRYRSSASAELHPDLHLRDFLSTVSSDLTIETLRQRHVFAFDAGDEQWIKRWTVYACLYAELEIEDTTFLLSSGKWYRVDRDLVRTVNRYVKDLARTTWLPKYADKSEGDYNKRVAAASGGKVALMDRKLIRVGGTTVEFCDLYSSDSELIHVKKYGGSSVLSHLFAQGSVSANAFLDDPAFRAALNSKLPRTHHLADPTARPDPRAHDVIFAIVSRSKRPIYEALPFFSRLNLKNAARQLRNLGFRVALCKIES